MYLLYNNNRAVQVREYNTPTEAINVDKVLGLFFQDSWTIASRLTLNLGVRYDHNVGTLPAQSAGDRQFVGAKSISEISPIKQNLTVWRTGAVYDPFGDSKTPPALVQPMRRAGPFSCHSSAIPDLNRAELVKRADRLASPLDRARLVRSLGEIFDRHDNVPVVERNMG